MRDTVIGFEAATFAVDKERRTLTGVLLPFGQVSRPARDRVTGAVNRYSFSAGTVSLPNVAEVPVIFNFGHDNESLEAQVGIATELSAKDDGVHAKVKIAKTPEGDRVLALAEDRILRAFSAEVGGEFADDENGIRTPTGPNAATITGGAVVLKPAFEGAQITDVAASAAQKEQTMKCTKCDKVHADGVTECATTGPAFTAADAQALKEQVDAQATQIAELQKMKIPVGSGGSGIEVKEEPIYRFAGDVGAPSGFDFATDVLAAARFGDKAALERVKTFAAGKLGPQDEPEKPQFVTTGNVDEVNPSQYRPDMFLGQAPTPASPLHDTFFVSSISGPTPFFYSKLDRGNTTVAVSDHTEGTDPTATNLVTAAGATVTPGPVSGKVHITREVDAQGGNPQVSGLVWSEFDRSYSIALETKTAALLTAGAGSVAALCTIAAGAAGDVAGRAIEAGLLGLQFLPDGARFTKAFGHVDLYTVLATFENSDGEKRYPIINPQNRSGISGDKYSFIDIAGYRMNPGTSLGATSTNASNSWVVDPTAVKVWNSGLERLDKLGEKVEGWDIGVFGWWAGLLYDASGLRKVAYDPTA